LLLLGGQMTPGRIELVEGKGDELARSAFFVVRLGVCVICDWWTHVGGLLMIFESSLARPL
jgi:hypothetical protein